MSLSVNESYVFSLKNLLINWLDSVPDQWERKLTDRFFSQR